MCQLIGCEPPTLFSRFWSFLFFGEHIYLFGLQKTRDLNFRIQRNSSAGKWRNRSIMARVVMDDFDQKEMDRLLHILRQASGLDGPGILAFALPDGWDYIARQYAVNLPQEPEYRPRPVRELREMYRRMIDSDGTGEGGDLSPNQVAFRQIRDRLGDLAAGVATNTGDCTKKKLFTGKWKAEEVDLLYRIYCDEAPRSYADIPKWSRVEAAYNSNPEVMKLNGKTGKGRQRAYSTMISRVKEMTKLDRCRGRRDEAKSEVDKLVMQARELGAAQQVQALDQKRRRSLKNKRSLLLHEERSYELAKLIVGAMDEVSENGLAIYVPPSCRDRPEVWNGFSPIHDVTCDMITAHNEYKERVSTPRQELASTGLSTTSAVPSESDDGSTATRKRKLDETLTEMRRQSQASSNRFAAFADKLESGIDSVVKAVKDNSRGLNDKLTTLKTLYDMQAMTHGEYVEAVQKCKDQLLSSIANLN